MSQPRRSICTLGAFGALALATLPGCLAAQADTAIPSGGTPVAVVASISSATLAEDCPPPAANGAAPRSAAKMDAEVARARRGCRQSAVQLSLASEAKGAPSTFQVVKAQLFDDLGDLIQTMTTRNPRVWAADAGHYLAWDGMVRPGQKLQVTYDMNAPNWSHARMGGSQMAAQGKVFRLELTVRAGNKETRISQSVRSAPLMIEPHVVT